MSGNEQARKMSTRALAGAPSSTAAQKAPAILSLLAQGPKKHVSIGMLHTMTARLLFVLDLRTNIEDPDVDVGCWRPSSGAEGVGTHRRCPAERSTRSPSKT